jgi:hypothetical protein
METPLYDLDAIRERLPMLTVCEREGMEFKRQGNNMVGPCWTCISPRGFTVHGETPHRAHCYSCGWGGDIFAFWKERRGLSSFPKAVAELAGLCGIGPSVSGVEFKHEKVVRKARTLAESGKPVMPELRKLNAREKRELAELRGLTVEGLEAAEDFARLWFSYYPVNKMTGAETASSVDSWCVTDPERWVAQWRRLDGELKDGKMRGKPYHSADGAPSLSTRNTPWPLGAAQMATYRAVALVEGGADMLAAYTALQAVGRLDDVAVVCILGGANNIAPEALPLFAGKRVRIFADNDPPREHPRRKGLIIRTGWETAAKWQMQLEEAKAASVDVVDFSSVPVPEGQPELKDLNDLVSLHLKQGGIDLEDLFSF